MKALIIYRSGRPRNMRRNNDSDSARVTQHVSIERLHIVISHPRQFAHNFTI